MEIPFYRSCEMSEKELRVFITSWDEKTIEVKFFNPISINYSPGHVITGVYEDTEGELLKEALSNYYLNLPEHHPFKLYHILDVDDCSIFKVVAEQVLIIKY